MPPKLRLQKEFMYIISIGLITRKNINDKLLIIVRAVQPLTIVLPYFIIFLLLFNDNATQAPTI